MKLVRYEELWVLVPPSEEVLQYPHILGPEANPEMWVEIPDELYERLEKSHKEFMAATREAEDEKLSR